MQEIKGKDAADSILKDVESFFYLSSKFSIKKEFFASSKTHALVRGTGGNTRIVLSRDLCDSDIKSLDDFFYTLIIVAHEIAHYLHKHTHHSDDPAGLDFHAIETWADFFGARLFIVVITHGRNTNRLINTLSKDVTRDDILKAIGRSISDIYKYIYCNTTSSKYPEPTQRVLSFTSGVTSYFYRAYDKLMPNFIAHVLFTILREANLVDILAQNSKINDNLPVIAKKSSDIHKSIQGGENAITKGMKLEFLHLLATNYNISEAEVTRDRRILISQAKKAGLNISLLEEHN